MREFAQNLVSTVSRQPLSQCKLTFCYACVHVGWFYEQDYTKTSEQFCWNFDGGRAPNQQSSRNIFSLSTEANKRHIFLKHEKRMKKKCRISDF